MYRKLLCVFMLLAFAAALPLAADAKIKKPQKHTTSEDTDIMPDTELIDIPTAGILEYYGLEVKSRFFSDGGVIGGLGFGVLPRLNLGASITGEKFIGTADPMRLVKPEIQAKYRFYDGSEYIPALAVGYDGQGYYYDHGAGKYYEKGRGLYMVGSQEVFTPHVMVHPGINVSDFNGHGVFGFIGANFTVEDAFSLMVEWDNIQRIDESRFNTGVRFYISPFFHLDLAVREIGANSTFENGTKRSPERIVQLRYISSF